MLLSTIAKNMDEINASMDASVNKINAYCESVLIDHEIAMKKAEAKFITESASLDDVCYLQEEADEGLVASIKKAIVKLIEKFKQFVADVKLRVLTLITKKETKMKMDEVEKKVKLNPFLRNKKITMIDQDENEKTFKWYMSELGKKLSKLKSGHLNESEDDDELSDLESEYRSRRARTAMKAIMTVTVVVGIGLVTKYRDKIGDVLQNAMKTSSALAEDAKGIINPSYASPAIQRAKNIADMAITGGRDFITSAVTFIKESMKNIIAIVSKTKDTITSESAEDFNDDTQDNSSNNDTSYDLNDYLEAAENDLFGSVTEESYTDDTTLDELFDF